MSDDCLERFDQVRTKVLLTDDDDDDDDAPRRLYEGAGFVRTADYPDAYLRID